ncbi:MAG TPA: MoaD/ThiS family protein [Planctomycetaceae bacterium]|nr:MoaD/ThiS family protein [Planctomycetaceae bacterium]
MKVKVEYAAQLKRAAGVSSEEFELTGPCSLGELLDRIVQRHGEAVRQALLDQDGRLHPSMLVFVGEDQVRRDQTRPLQDGDVVTFLPPISGG